MTKAVKTEYSVKNMQKSPKQNLTNKCLMGLTSTLITLYY